MPAAREGYKSDLDDETYTFMLLYLLLRPEDAPQRTHPLRDVLNALFYVARTGVQCLGQSGTSRACPLAVPPTRLSTPRNRASTSRALV